MHVVILDGGMGTELARRGLGVSDSLWSARILLNHPEAIEQVHFDYLEAGADCITTASYQVSSESFVKAELTEEQARGALARSVELAKQARSKWMKLHPGKKEPWVAASVGPYGASLANGSEYHGNYACTFAELVAFHYHRIHVLEKTEPDLLACETIPSWGEAEALVEALRHFPLLSAWISFTCRDGRTTAHGESVRDCARILNRERQVVAIGVNCTAPEHIPFLITEIRSVTEKPIVVYPNSGQSWDAVHRCWRGEPTGDDLAERSVEWYARGARWIGGCCGTTPMNIRAMRAELQKRFPEGFAD